MAPRDLAELTSRLFARAPEQNIEPSLERIRDLLDLMGNPQGSAPVIQVTGTNGKTSTARMIDSLLRGLGLRTGLYTSPHLESITERIVIDGEPIAEDRFLALYAENEPLIGIVDADLVAAGEQPLTFFEVLTALGFAAFADAPVDAVVLEVGLGGTWDATNVADAAVAVVTPIALDHTNWLGHSIADIAREKAGIIKPDSVAILGQQTVEAAEVLLTRIADLGVSVAREGLEFGVIDATLAVGGQEVSLQGLRERYDGILLPLFGAHQASNAAIALAAVEAFLPSQTLADEVVREAFAAVTVPGRLEVLRKSPSVIVDAAHNPAGATALAQALATSFGFAATCAVVAVLADKDVAGILEALEPVIDHVVCTANDSTRSLPTADLVSAAQEVFGTDRVSEAEDIATAYESAINWADERVELGPVGIIVTGSVVTVGAVRRLLNQS